MSDEENNENTSILNNISDEENNKTTSISSKITDEENNEITSILDKMSEEENNENTSISNKIPDEENSENTSILDKMSDEENNESTSILNKMSDEENNENTSILNKMSDEENNETTSLLNIDENTEITPLIKKENKNAVNEKPSTSNYLAVQQEYDENDLLSIYNENDILFFVKEDKKGSSFKSRVGYMLNTTAWNTAILVMITCDVLIVVLELFVQLNEKKQCTPIEKPQNTDDLFISAVHHLGYVSDIFLCIFTAEVLLHFYCFGFKYFFEAWINFIDAVTVLLTFVTTILISFYFASDKAQGFVDILIILRFWRIFCLVESVVNATQLEANLRFKEVLIDLNAEVRILENRKNCYAEKLTELGYDLSQLENDYLFPKYPKQRKIKKSNNDNDINDDIIINVPNNYYN